jgi:cell cycle checkpoint protein
VQSSWLREALSELDPSCDKLTIIGNPPPPSGRAPRPSQPRLRLKAVGTFGSTEVSVYASLSPEYLLTVVQMDYPSDKEVLETCDCPAPVSFRSVFRTFRYYLHEFNGDLSTSSYSFKHISKALRALMSSTKTSLRIDEDGLLSFQFLMPAPKPKGGGGGGDAFIEFRVRGISTFNLR